MRQLQSDKYHLIKGKYLSTFFHDLHVGIFKARKARDIAFRLSVYLFCFDKVKITGTFLVLRTLTLFKNIYCKNFAQGIIIKKDWLNRFQP